jgi:hypothetical protein
MPTGVRAETMCVSSQFVYVLSPNHECFIRHGITCSSPDGEYWKKIPGTFAAISCGWNLPLNLDKIFCELFVAVRF